jgi:hypothetical protein
VRIRLEDSEVPSVRHLIPRRYHKPATGAVCSAEDRCCPNEQSGGGKAGVEIAMGRRPCLKKKHLLRNTEEVFFWFKYVIAGLIAFTKTIG